MAAPARSAVIQRLRIRIEESLSIEMKVFASFYKKKRFLTLRAQAVLF
jgi:hypothetical protein